MDPAPLLRGLALGVAVAAPVGPMSLLCMRRTLAGGFFAGLLSGLGVATADGLYGAVAAFGLVAVTEILVGHGMWLRLLAGAALLYLGLRTLRTPSAERPAVAGAGGLAAMYVTTLTLTLANPATILSFAALFAGLGLGDGARDDIAMVLGVFLGSALWWLLLTGGIALVQRRLPGRLLCSVNTLSGLAIAAFGVLAVASAITAG